MKKKFLAIVAVIIAFVMCFAFVACGNNPDGNNPDGNNPGGNTSVNAGVAKKAVNAVTDVLDANGVSGKVEINLAQTGKTPLKLSGSFEKSGDRVKFVDGDDVCVIDLKTGYMYYLENGVVVNCVAAIPAGVYAYLTHMLDQSDGTLVTADQWASADDKLTYNADTKTVSYDLDLAEHVNDLTAPLYEGYKNKQNLTWLIDRYLLELSGETVKFSPFDDGETGISIIDTISKFATTFPTYTVGSVLESLKAFGVDVEAILDEQDIDVIELLDNMGIKTTKAALKARTIENVVVGAYKAIMLAMQPDGNQPMALAEDDEGGMDSSMVEGMMQMLPVILEGAVNGVKEEGDPSAAQIVDGLLTQLLGITDSMKVDALVDEMLAPVQPEVAAVIKAGVQLKELSLHTAVKLDANDKLASLNIAGVFEHDYKGTVTEDFVILGSNKYTFDVKLDITAYNDSPEAITFKYGEVTEYKGYHISSTVLMGDTVKEDVKIYVEFCGQQNLENVTVQVGGCENIYDENWGGYKYIVVPNENITYDKATSTVTIKAAYLNKYFSEAGSGTPFLWGMEVNVDEGYVSTTVTSVLLLTDNMEELPTALGNLFGSLMG